MPKLLFARTPKDNDEEQKIQKLARSRHGPLDVSLRARTIAASWQGHRTTPLLWSWIAIHKPCVIGCIASMKQV